jgi:hypothetical protein
VLRIAGSHGPIALAQNVARSGQSRGDWVYVGGRRHLDQLGLRKHLHSHGHANHDGIMNGPLPSIFRVFALPSSRTARV